MSKLDIRAAVRESGINCEFEGRPGKVLLVTDAMIANYGAPDDARSPEVEAGEIVVSYHDGEKVRGRVILPEANNDLALMLRDADGEEVRVEIGSMDELLSAVRDARVEGDAPAKTAKAVETLNEFAETVFEGILHSNGLHEPALVSTALSYQFDRARRADLAEGGLTAEQLDKITLARSLRETIGRVNPDHEDAIVKDAAYASQGRATDLLEDLGVYGRGFSATQMAGLRANRDLTEKVFGAMTTTSISDVNPRLLDAEEFATLRQEMRPGLVKGGFNKVINDRLDNIFEKYMANYVSSVELYTKGGADLLLVKDHVGHYAYGWDTASRVLEIPDAGVLVLGEADVPSDEEIERLQAVVADIRYENGDEIAFDLFDQDDEEIDLDEEDWGFGDDEPENEDPGFRY